MIYNLLNKGFTLRLSFLFCLIFIHITGNTTTGGHQISGLNEHTSEMVNGHRTVRGERPPMQLTPADSSAWDPGILIIKFERDLEKHLDQHGYRHDNENNIVFGLPVLDSLNIRHGVSDAKQYFLSGALGYGFTDRHKAWGFHLWYVLEVNTKADIVKMVQDYERLPEIEIAVPSFTITLSDSGDDVIPNDPLFIHQWSYKNTGQHNGIPGADISLPQALAIEQGDTSVVVAVIDGGIDIVHEDLHANIWYQVGYNFVHDSPVLEPHGHGTLVAGIVAAKTNNETGVAGIAGGSEPNDGIRMMSAQIFAQSGANGTHVAPVYAADNGAAISQNSWGWSTPGFYNPATLDAIDYFNTYGGGEVLEGGLTITSSGNSNSDEGFYPGYYSGALSVSGTNNRDEKAWYSNFGSYIDIAAPGGETNTVTEQGVLTTHLNNTYGYSQGTSVSCPHVSGVAALLVSYAYRNNHILTNQEVWQFLTENTDEIDPYIPKYAGKMGSGRLNAFKVLQAAANTLGNVTNPGNFSATPASETQLDLEWTPNTAQNDVLLVWSHEDTFGTPVSGTLYGAGETLDGGGTVLYAGAGSEYTHSDLQPGITYFYKIFSYDDVVDYSFGRQTSATTPAPIIVVRGLNKEYSIIPKTQLPQAIQLAAGVTNTGSTLVYESNILFSVAEAAYSASAPVDAPFFKGDEKTVYAEPPWETGNLETGAYTISWESDHEWSPEEDKTDLFVLNVSDSLYARDSGNLVNGVGSSTDAITLGTRYEIHTQTAISEVLVGWPDMELDPLDFRIALYRVNQNNIVQEAMFVSDLLTRMPYMQNSFYAFSVEEVLLDPGLYILAIMQLTHENLFAGTDNQESGYFYRANITEEPSSFPHTQTGFGNLALRMVLHEPDPTTPTQNVMAEPRIWYNDQVLYMINPFGKAKVVLYNISGQALFSAHASSGHNTFAPDLRPGVYVLGVYSNRKSWHQKLWVK